MKKRVLVAMSGGVDSSVAAYLLKEQGYDVIGATIKTWKQDACNTERAKGCCSLKDVDDARSVAGRLGIPFYVLDLSADFQEKVIDYFVDTYLDAKTPNPCIACNDKIKFGVFLEKAREIQADCVATGHYARRQQDTKTGRWIIREGVDREKDQSYVLFGLTQEQIKSTLLPVGSYHKDAIRRMAEKLGLRVFDKPDSQDICFVPRHYREVIEREATELPGRGQIVDQEGNVLGEHDGYHLYTIGQRKSLRIPSHLSLFVVDIDKSLNRVIVGKERNLFKRYMKLERTNWMLEPILRKTYDVKIRSRNYKAKGSFVELTSSEALFQYHLPEKSVTPGQAAVIYDRDRVLGGGWIDSAYNESLKPVLAV